MQEIAFSVGLPDIPYNFLIGGDGNFYEIMGENLHQGGLSLYSNLGLTVGFIGNFTEIVPNIAALEIALKELKSLTPSYKIISADQLMQIQHPFANVSTTQTLVALRTMPQFHECK